MAKCSVCGQGGVFLKLNAAGRCADCEYREREKFQGELNKLQGEYNDLAASITPEMRDFSSLEKSISAMRSEKESYDAQIQTAEAELASLRKQILVAGDMIELEEFGLYYPRYSFANSDGYKEKLDEIRSLQKEMIKLKVAVTCYSSWMISSSERDGKKLAENLTKIFLRAFNDECEAAINDVKFNNFERCAARINKAYEDCNKIGAMAKISIANRYLQLKIAELQLALEYAQKKQQEKEEQAEIRRQQREQAKLEKEIAEARKAAEKERLHHEQAMASIEAQIFACTDPTRKAELEAKREEIKSGLDQIQAKLEDIDYRQSNQRAGYVYVISNIGAFGEGVYKIGMTRRLNPMERVDELGDASVPFNFDVHAMIFSADAPALETALHHAFFDRRLNKVNNRREYFRVSLDEIKDVIRANHDQSVEFVDVPAAEQYRESIRM